MKNIHKLRYGKTRLYTYKLRPNNAEKYSI